MVREIQNKMATAKACEDTSDHLSDVFGVINEIFGVELHVYQKDCLKNLINKVDCFVSQPTGSGKSLCYQAAPFFLELVIMI